MRIDKGLVANLDIYLAAIGLLLTVAGTTFLVLAVGKYFEVGAIAGLCCLFYLIIRKRLMSGSLSDFYDLHGSRTTLLITSIIFFGVYFLSNFVVITRQSLYSRPTEYFLLIAFAASILMVEIVLSPKSPAHHMFILFKVMLLALSVRWITQVMFPGLAGVDTWYHQMLTERLIETAAMPSGELYTNLPIMHITVATTSLLAGMEYKYAAMLSVSLMQVLSLIFVFVIGSAMSHPKAGLLAALLLSFNGIWVGIGSGVHPTTLGLIYVCFIISLILGTTNYKSKAILFILLTSMVVLIMTHTLSALTLAVIMLLLYAGSKVYKVIYHRDEQELGSLYIFSFFILSMFGWWAYASGYMSSLISIVKWGFKIDSVQVPSISYQTAAPYIETLLPQLGFLTFFGLSAVGTFYFISKQFSNIKSVSLLLSGITFLAIAFISLVGNFTGLYAHRWWWSATLIMAIPSAVGVLALASFYKNKIQIIVTSWAMLAVLSFLGITTPNSNFDNRLLSKNTAGRNAFTYSELISLDTLTNITNGKIGAASPQDMYYLQYHRNTQPIDISPNLLMKDFSEYQTTMIMLRNEEIYNYFETTAGGGLKLDYDPSKVLESEGYNHTYASEAVNAYIK